ncbi:MAG: ABC-F family ATP-binding cassette domain-containing protein [Planctomycetes bacterium]|nr:ABC-F family ATP-binding cassette domain-containing protein [Planctomycetota bacterium]
MSLVLATGLRRHFGARDVLNGVDLRIEAGEKIGLVGRNGEGKTTLLRLIEGEEQPDGGKIDVQRGVRLGYVSQRPEFPAGRTVLQYVQSGMQEAQDVARQLAELEHEMGGAEGEALERILQRHGELGARMEFLGGWQSEHRVESVLDGIGLAPALWEREARTLSGGEKSRALLARELVSAPDVLLLDEPTNHLDLEGIEWLEAYLKELRGAVLVVSHDRRLLDRAVSVIYELERGQLVRYPGNYSQYVALKDERYKADLRAWRDQQDFIRKEEEFIRRNMGSQRTAEAKGRQKKLENLVRLPEPWHDVRRPVIRMKSGDRSGEAVLETVDLAVGHGTRRILEHVEIRVDRGERIGIVGRNGSGKTTLLRVLANRTQPLAGRVVPGHKTVCGYFDQESAELAGSGEYGPKTPFEFVMRAWPLMTELEIRSHLAKFLFRGDAVNVPVTTLSGGERARMALALLVLEQPNWLALDEPTNHLDLAARTALEEFLDAFDGALVVVSHDREFLDNLCNVTLEVRAGGVRRVAGNYSTWRALVQREREEALATKQAQEAAAAKRAAAQALKEREAVGAAGAMAETAPKAGSRAGGGKVKNPWLLEKIEKAIIALEEERAQLEAALVTEEVYRNASRMKGAQIRLAEVERELELKNSEWESWA